MKNKKETLNPRVVELLKKYKEIKKQKRKDRKAKGLCCAVLCHGPGHQSETFCELTGPHKIHSATYGRYDQVMEWKGKEAFTGYFDEPKDL